MNILGIHLDFPFLHVSCVRKNRKGIEVLWVKTISLKENDPKKTIDALLSTEANTAIAKKSNRSTRASSSVKMHYSSSELDLQNSKGAVKPLYISASPKEVLREIKNFRGKIVSGLSAKDFLIRLIDIKISNLKAAAQAITFQSTALSHFKPNEAITLPIIEKKEKGRTEALLFTVPRSGIKEHLEELKKLEVEPDVLSSVPSAMCHFIRWKFPTLHEAFIIDLGSSAITCALIEKGGLKKAHAIPLGIEELLEALYEDRKRILLKKEIADAAKQIDLMLLKSHLNPRLSEELTGLRHELAKTYFSFTRDAAKPIIFTGRSDAFIHLREFLIDFSLAEWPLSIEEQKSAIPLGLCLEQTSKEPVQLLREEFFPKKNWVQMGIISLFILAISTLLSIGLFWAGTRFAKETKEKMLEHLQMPLRKQLLSHGNMEDQIDQWIHEIKKCNQEYPYIAQTPKVSEILSWLSSHPLLEELKRENDPIDIRELRVHLESFPTIHSENESYLEKVEIEFQFKNLMNARRFHEALRAGDSLVNPRKQITWDTLNDGYRTSFYLKNRSPYVP